LVVLATFSLMGCESGEGSVQVDVGTAPLAAAYRVDLYDDQGGLGLIEGKSIVQGSEVTFDDVPEGRWSVLIQAQNGDNTTIAHYIGKTVVKANEVTEFAAGTYLPGLPGSPAPESDTELDSFGPDGSALLTAIYGPGIDTLPPSAVALTVENGTGEAQVVEAQTLSALGKLGREQVQGCATAWLAAQEKAEKTLAQTTPTPTPTEPAPNYGSLAPGETASFFIATTFQETECARVLSDSQTEHCLIFAEVVDGTTVIDEARALEVANSFDNDNPFQEGDAGIYEETRARFGSEWTTNPVGGRDQDERVILVFLSSDSIGGAGFFGFFRPQDEQSREQVSNSNEGEILFINADRTNDDLYDALSTISHEFVHLILFNQKRGQNGTFPEGATSENATIDEGMAVLNEDLSGFTFSGPQGGNFFLLASVEDLLIEGLNRPFFQFAGGLDDYGAGYLLCRFLHDQFGAQKIREITTSTATGRDNIATVVQQPFPSVFANFAQAVALNGEAGLPPELSYETLDLNATYTDRDGEVFPMNGLQGIGDVTLPGSLEVEATLEPWGSVFYRATGGDGSALSWKATGVDSLLTKIYDSVAGPDPDPTPSETPAPEPTP
jgi:hypothetical protein